MHGRFSLFLSILAFALPSVARSQGYTYTNIADTSAGSFFNGFGGAPGINDAGTVAFYGRSGTLDKGIYTRMGGNPTTVIDLNSSFNGNPLGLTDIGFNPSINNAGTVALVAQQGGSYQSIVVTSSGSLQQFTTLDNSTLSLASTYTRVNAQDDFMMTASLNNLGGEKVVFDSAGYPIFSGDDSGQIDTTSLFVNPAVNDSGLVVAIARSPGGTLGIYTRTAAPPSSGYSVGPITAAITADDSAFSGFTRTTVANDGTIFFNAALDAGGSGVFSLKDGEVSTIALTTDGVFQNFTYLSCNDDGAVAFLGQLTGGTERAIYLSLDGQLTRVIGTGDELFGSTVQNVLFGTDGLNNDGQVAFHYTLANGISGVTLASPVPEPSTVALVALALVGLHFRRQVTRR